MALLDILREKHGPEYHPAILLAEVSEDTEADIKLRVDCAKTLMPYIESTLKSVEVRGQIDSNVGLLRISRFDQEQLEKAVEEENE